MFESIKEGTSILSYGYEDAGYISFVLPLCKQKNVNYLNYRHVQRHWSVDIYKGFDNVIESGSTGLLWQAGLVDLVLYNFRQSLENGTFIPCLFSSSGDEMHRISSVDIPASVRPTTLEILQVYQLCENKELPETLRIMAKKTFRFVHAKTYMPINKATSFEAYFEPLPLPWEDPKEYDRVRGIPLSSDYEYEMAKCEYQSQWFINGTSKFYKDFWLNAVRRFIFEIQENKPSNAMTCQLYPRFEYNEWACFDGLIEFQAAHGRYDLALTLIASLENSYNKSRGYNHLITAYLKEDNRAQAIACLDKMYSYYEQIDAVKKIVTYDLSQKSPDYEAMVALVEKPYGGHIGITESQQRVAETLIRRSQFLKAVKVIGLMKSPSDYWCESMSSLTKHVLTKTLTSYLDTNNRSAAIVFLDNLGLYGLENLAVKQIVEYDLKQNPPDFKGAVSLVMGDYGDSENKQLVVNALIKNQQMAEVPAIIATMPFACKTWRAEVERLIEQSSAKPISSEASKVKVSTMGMFSASVSDAISCVSQNLCPQ